MIEPRNCGFAEKENRGFSVHALELDSYKNYTELGKNEISQPPDKIAASDKAWYTQ